MCVCVGGGFSIQYCMVRISHRLQWTYRIRQVVTISCLCMCVLNANAFMPTHKQWALFSKLVKYFLFSYRKIGLIKMFVFCLTFSDKFTKIRI